MFGSLCLRIEEHLASNVPMSSILVGKMGETEDSNLMAKGLQPVILARVMSQTPVSPKANSRIVIARIYMRHVRVTLGGGSVKLI